MIEQKKEEKRQALLDAAYELFLEHGPLKASVGDITARAKVAKGTFYLYFHDKDALMQALLVRISSTVIEGAYRHVQEMGPQPLADKVVAMADYVIEYFRREKGVLRLVRRNLQWPSMEFIEVESENTPLIRRILDELLSAPELQGRTEEEIYQRTAVLFGMCTSVCYSAILENKPDTIDNLKPILYDIIRRSI